MTCFLEWSQHDRENLYKVHGPKICTVTGFQWIRARKSNLTYRIHYMWKNKPSLCSWPDLKQISACLWPWVNSPRLMNSHNWEASRETVFLKHSLDPTDVRTGHERLYCVRLDDCSGPCVSARFTFHLLRGSHCFKLEFTFPALTHSIQILLKIS